MLHLAFTWIPLEEAMSPVINPNKTWKCMKTRCLLLQISDLDA